LCVKRFSLATVFSVVTVSVRWPSVGLPVSNSAWHGCRYRVRPGGCVVPWRSVAPMPLELCRLYRWCVRLDMSLTNWVHRAQSTVLRRTSRQSRCSCFYLERCDVTYQVMHVMLCVLVQYECGAGCIRHGVHNEYGGSIRNGSSINITVCRHLDIVIVLLEFRHSYYFRAPR
jgi:hypothetical protein